MTTILHVEDDELLAEAVQTVFDNFGFGGTYLPARSVREAKALLAQSPGPTIDLILSDMKLPDGTGLDVVQMVRADPARATVPIVILSGDTDPRTVDHAYVLGASSYISKGERGRTLSGTLQALYGHWLRDAHLPTGASRNRTQQYLARAASIRAQKAAVYLQVAQQLGVEDGAMWMDVALRSGNLANLFGFLMGQLEGRELPDSLLDEVEAAQHRLLREIADIARKPVRTEEDAQHYALDVISDIHVDVLNRALALLFPDANVATTALRRIIGGALDEVASWIEGHAKDPGLRDQIPRLRAEANQIQSP